MWHLLRRGQNIGQAPWAFDRLVMCAIKVFHQSINTVFPIYACHFTTQVRKLVSARVVLKKEIQNLTICILKGVVIVRPSVGGRCVALVSQPVQPVTERLLVATDVHRLKVTVNGWTGHS
jgi:hypothetical protein